MSLLRIPSLRWRLIVVMTVAYVIVATLSGAAGYTAQRTNLHKQIVARARANAAILAAGAAASLSSGGSKPILQEYVDSIQSANGLGVTYADIRRNNCIFVSTTSVKFGPKRCQDFGWATTQPEYKVLPDGSVMGAAPIAPGALGTFFGHAVVILPNSSVEEDLRASLIRDTLVRLFGLVVFILLSLLIAQYILRPLTELSRAARAIRRGRFGVRMPESNTTELATVSEAFNDMAASLEERIKHLSFLARSGARLPNTLRQPDQVQPLLEEFGEALHASAAGLVGRENEVLWCSGDEERCRAAIEQVGLNSTMPTTEERDGLVMMAIPVRGDMVFVTARNAERPFTDEEEVVITNFAHQMGIAADNVRLFEAQQEALQVKDQFLSIVSHELRTPLTTMKGYAQMLRRRLADDPDGQRFAKSIDAQVGRLSRLVDDLLDVTRFSRGQFELTRRYIDLRPILEDVVNRFRVIAPKHNLQVEFAGDSFAGYWDRDRLEQVLNNLLGNAIKYSPAGGEVTVRAQQEDGRLVVSVRDQGVGIPEEEQQRLFERFYRGSAEAFDVKGLGLGLYVTRHVVDAHGGEVMVSSKPGQGSEFSFTLPLTEAPKAEAVRS